jgi:Tol biopolymer transport system component
MHVAKLLVAASVVAGTVALTLPAHAATKGTLYVNRVGPVASDLYVANADGSGEHKLLTTPGFDYHASFSRDGQWVVFTSERAGLGQSDIWRVKADGSGLQQLTTHIAVDDQAVFSPTNPDIIAFVSSRSGDNAWAESNVWTLQISTGKLTNVTGKLPFTPDRPHAYLRPAWSNDGKWLALSSDVGTDWRGHDLPVGWERTQESSIYVVHPDGSGLRKVAGKAGFAEGSPTWSPDDSAIAFYETPEEQTWGVRRPEGIAKVSSQLVEVNVSSGERKELTTTPGFKVFPQYLDAKTLAYHVKGGPTEGLYTTAGGFRATPNTGLRSPHWSADGKQMVYEKVSFRPARENGAPLFSFDPEWTYRYIDVFPQLSHDGKQLVYTEKAKNSSVGLVNAADLSNYKRLYDASTSGIDAKLIQFGLAGAFQPTLTSDNQWVAFGVGQWFFTRAMGTGTILRIRTDGSMDGKPEPLTDGSINSGFPSYSPDGRKIVYRVWSPKEKGLRLLDPETKVSTVLTTEPDNTPGWSPDGKRIVFARKLIDANDPNKYHYAVYTIKPDGTGLTRLTTGGHNDAHAVWSWDGRIVYNSTVYGYRDEVALYDNTFQPDGQVWVMNADGTNKRPVSDTLWEDAMPLYVPNQ